MDYAALAMAWYVVLLVSLSFHEAAHGFAAMKLGDTTAYHGGQVTLDPIPHIRREPFGMVVFPILSFLLAGWMIGWASTIRPIVGAKVPSQSGADVPGWSDGQFYSCGNSGADNPNRNGYRIFPRTGCNRLQQGYGGVIGWVCQFGGGSGKYSLFAESYPAGF